VKEAGAGECRKNETGNPPDQSIPASQWTMLSTNCWLCGASGWVIPTGGESGPVFLEVNMAVDLNHRLSRYRARIG